MSNEQISERISFYQFSDPPNALPSNAVSSVVLDVCTQEAAPIQCTLNRAGGRPNKPHIFKGNWRRDNSDTPPPRPPSSLPPPSNLMLALKLGQQLGHGRSGVVYEATIDLEDSSPGFAAFSVPLLAVKVSKKRHHKDVKHEAFYYDEMECLQGVIVPRFYGLFKGRVPRQTSRILSGTSSDSDSSSSSDDTDGTEEHTASKIGHSSKPVTPVAVLILECLDGLLPMGKDLPPKTLEEIGDMYTHLAILGIDHVDIRHANILYAPTSPPGWPSLVSPYSHVPYRWRLVDFEHARKTNQRLDVFAQYHEQLVTRLIENLPDGYVIEPWEL